MNWEKRLTSAKLRGRFTQEDIHMANLWPTCAIGENEALAGNILEGNFTLTDEKTHLGLQFDHQVNDQLPGEAAETYQTIQALYGVGEAA